MAIETTTEAATKVVCGLCNDTHEVFSAQLEREVMCTSCPTPCRKCANHEGRGAYCSKTPCDCDCGHHGFYSRGNSPIPVVAEPHKRMTKLMGQLVDHEGEAKRELLAATLEESAAIKAQGGEAHSVRSHKARHRRILAAETWTKAVAAIVAERSCPAAELVQIPMGELLCIRRALVEASKYVVTDSIKTGLLTLEVHGVI